MSTPPRWLLYLLSISPLLIFLGLYNLDWGTCFELECILSSAKSTITAIILLIIGVVALLSLGFFKAQVLDANAGSLSTIKKIENKDYEMLTFFFTYIIPLVTFGQDLADDHLKETIAFVTIMIALGYLYVRTDLYMSNPVLLYFNLHLYRIETSDEEHLTILSKDHVVIGDAVGLRYLSSSTAIAVKHDSI